MPNRNNGHHHGHHHHGPLNVAAILCIAYQCAIGGLAAVTIDYNVMTREEQSYSTGWKVCCGLLAAILFVAEVVGGYRLMCQTTSETASGGDSLTVDFARGEVAPGEEAVFVQPNGLQGDDNWGDVEHGHGAEGYTPPKSGI